MSEPRGMMISIELLNAKQNGNMRTNQQTNMQIRNTNPNQSHQNHANQTRKKNKKHKKKRNYNKTHDRDHNECVKHNKLMKEYIQIGYSKQIIFCESKEQQIQLMRTKHSEAQVSMESNASTLSKQQLIMEKRITKQSQEKELVMKGTLCFVYPYFNPCFHWLHRKRVRKAQYF